MITFKLGGFKTDAGRTGVVLPSASSQGSIINKLSELGLLPLAFRPPLAQPVDISQGSPEPPAAEKTERFYSDGRRMQRWKLCCSSLPLSFALAFGFYLFFTGTPQWIAGAVMLAGLLVFGLAGLLIEQYRLRVFDCPHCRAPVEDWDTNDTRRILFNCPRCGSRWDIEYKLRPGYQPPFVARRNQFRRSEFCALCSPRGAP